ncbi:hypothetical protein BEP19_01305 [Ammoniphilus oxalaticus]|uniref:AB hydrolase-1 domain-containing protein n=1 Tax=Ammoniphilus oxalaticus TaxID=66863 RepID=A0A419SMU0_9BACL|nr:alpha/beta hydrolase [Ammoniphilus oxalaticus]RKD25608.1 hypothetical protein BEP19_01305 [Ammoniphilus oxalaticus]
MNTFLLLPGWGMESAVWSLSRSFQDGLAELGELVMVDWRGVRSEVDFMDRVVEKAIGRRAPLMVIGWSLGSLVALDFAKRYPSFVSKLILIGGTSRFTITDGYEQAGYAPRRLQGLKRQLARDPQQTLHAFYESMFSDSERRRGFDQQFIADVEAQFAGDEVASLGGGLDYLRAADARLSLSEQPPLLLVHGEQDSVCPLASAQFIAEQAPIAMLRTIPDAGHVPFYTQPQTCLHWIQSFVKGGAFVDR